VKPILPSILGLAVLAAACGGDAAPRPGDVAPAVVALARVEATDLPSTFDAGGIVRAETTAAIASRLLAPVTAVHVRAGDRVRAGARLVTLEGRAIAATRAQALAAAAGSDEGVRAAEGSVRAAEASLALARATFGRVQTLHAKRSATPQELDQATAAQDGAQAQLASARATLAAAVASRTAAGAGADAAAANVADTTLTAPFDAVVTERAVDPGDMAVPGVRLLTLEDPRALRLEITLDEARAPQMSAARTARVWLGEAAGDAGVEATVAEIARVDPASHSFVVKLALPAGVQARSGTFGRARFDGQARTALVIPASAAVRRGQLTFVYAAGEDGRARLQPISPGLLWDGRLEVLAGLDAGVRVVVHPPASLTDGTRLSEAAR